MRKRGRPVGTFSNPVRHDHPAYRVWSGMKQRCYNPRSHIWKYYGGRGIKVCPRWLGENGFRNFYADMGDPKGLTIDRYPNPDGDYSPDNCRWATMKQQMETRRHSGPAPDPSSLRQKAKAAGLPYSLVYLRVNRGGWTVAKALNTPKQPRGRRIGFVLSGSKSQWKIY